METEAGVFSSDLPCAQPGQLSQERDDGSVRLFEKTPFETSAKGGSWTAERLAMGHPTRVCNLIRATCKI